MKKRALGSTGVMVSEIAFGGVEIGLPYGIGVNGPEDMLSEADAIQLLHAAIDSGVNFFDTARMYGNSEALMGKAFKGRRDEVVIATKCIHLRNREGHLPSDGELEGLIESSLFQSLEALQTETVDIFMLHQADLEILSNKKIAEVFQKLMKQGRFKSCGVSTYTNEETRKAIEAGVWNVVQLPFNLMDQRQGALFNKAAEHGIGIIIRSVLLKGLLSDKGRGLHPALKNVEDHIKEYNKLLGRSASDLSTFATKFALSFSQVASILVGIDREQYLKTAIASADGNYLTEEELKKAKNLAYPVPTFLDLPYWEKMGWLR